VNNKLTKSSAFVN